MLISKLISECKDYIWGGQKLKTKYGKITDKDILAESWELSFHKDALTKLENGKTLVESVLEKDLGENVKNFPFFPVLIKFLDAKENLSVQVHPSDDYALKNENSFGKTEMWYVVESEPGAGIYLGFNKNVSKEEYETAIKEKRLIELLNFFEVKAGDCFFIPSGTIHAIGKGCLIYEIQQNSNLTYRVYDYGRKDKFGNERQLHVDKALKVTNLNKFTPLVFNDCLGRCKYFTVLKHNVNGELNLYADNKSFNCITSLNGQGFINDMSINKGDTFFIPAGTGNYVIKGNLEIIETKV